MSDVEGFCLAAVMGWPVMHSRSPVMHKFWMDQQGLTGSYLPLAVKPGKIGPALRAMHPLGFAGCNLTIPHKQDAMKFVDEVDDIANKIGAISCVVVREDGSLFGTNNDWLGFLGSLREFHPDWRANAGPAMVIGAGGGARAVCYALQHEGATDIRVVNRTRENAERLARDMGPPLTVYSWEERHELLDGLTMVVNVSSQGMKGEDVLDIKLDKLPNDALVIDIIYIPLETPFLAAARKRGNPTINGLGMLLHQGPPAWKYWFGIEPEVSAELRSEIERSIYRDFQA